MRRGVRWAWTYEWRVVAVVTLRRRFWRRFEGVDGNVLAEVADGDGKWRALQRFAGRVEGDHGNCESGRRDAGRILGL